MLLGKEAASDKVFSYSHTYVISIVLASGRGILCNVYTVGWQCYMFAGLSSTVTCFFLGCFMFVCGWYGLFLCALCECLCIPVHVKGKTMCIRSSQLSSIIYNSPSLSSAITLHSPSLYPSLSRPPLRCTAFILADASVSWYSSLCLP